MVIDHREDKNADTGQFELAYKQRMPSCQPYLGAALSLQGTRISICGKKSILNSQESKVSLVSKSPMVGKLEFKSFMNNFLILGAREFMIILFNVEFYIL